MASTDSITTIPWYFTTMDPSLPPQQVCNPTLYYPVVYKPPEPPPNSLYQTLPQNFHPYNFESHSSQATYAPQMFDRSPERVLVTTTLTSSPMFQPTPQPFHNPYGLDQYTPPEIPPPYTYHPPQPPEDTPPTPPLSHYVQPSPCLYTPLINLTCHTTLSTKQPFYAVETLTSMTSTIATSDMGTVVADSQLLVTPQVFDESPHSPELIVNSSNDNYHQRYDKFTEIIQKLEEIGKNLADRSRISKEMSSKKVSQSSHTLTHVPIVSNLDKSAIIEKTGNVDSKQQLDILAPHMFDESPENEYVALDKHFPTTPCAGQVYSDVESSQPTVVETLVESLNCDNRVFDVNYGINVNEKKRIMKLFNDHDDTPVRDEDESKGIANEVWKEIMNEKSGDSTFEGSFDESESPIQIVDFSKGKLDSTRRNRSSGGMLAVNSVFVGVKTVGFENEEEWGVEEIERKDIEDWKVLKSKYTLALRSVDVKRNLDEDKGRSGKVLEVSSLKEVLEDDDMKKNEENNVTEESKNSGDQSCEAQYVLPKINGLDDLSNIVCDRILIIFDPGGYKRNVACVVIMLKEMNRSSEVGLDGIAKVISACSVVNVREDMGSKVMNRRERFESKRGIEGGRATHDCSHFVTLIGDLKSIKKIYDEMFDTYNEDKNARISDMDKQKYVGESFEVFDYMYKKHLYSWNLRMTRYSKMRNMEPARLLFDDSSGKKVEPEKKVRFESNSINLLNILSIGRHGGLIYELQPFTEMVTACGKVSGIKLYGCFIDMPERSERLNKVDNRQACYFYVTCILSCLPWGGSELIEQVPEEIERVVVGIEAYVSIRRHCSDIGLSVFEDSEEHVFAGARELYLEKCLKDLADDFMGETEVF